MTWQIHFTIYGFQVIIYVCLLDGRLVLFASSQHAARKCKLDDRCEVPGSEPLHYVGLLPDLAQGIRLEGSDAGRVRELLSDDGRVWMKLRLKGMSPPLPRVQAELCWGLGEKPHFMTGWRFTDIDSETIQLIEVYVAEHQEDIIEEEP